MCEERLLIDEVGVAGLNDVALRRRELPPAASVDPWTAAPLESQVGETWDSVCVRLCCVLVLSVGDALNGESTSPGTISLPLPFVGELLLGISAL